MLKLNPLTIAIGLINHSIVMGSLSLNSKPKTKPKRGSTNNKPQAKPKLTAARIKASRAAMKESLDKSYDDPVGTETTQTPVHSQRKKTTVIKW